MRKAFVNSLPKSGTNLVGKCLELFGYRQLSGFASKARPVGALRKRDQGSYVGALRKHDQVSYVGALRKRDQGSYVGALRKRDQGS